MEFTNEQLENVIAQYRNGDTTAKNKIAKMLYCHAWNMIKYLNISNKIKIDHGHSARKIAKECLEKKIKKFNPEKGKALSYFSICMLGWLRTEYRNKKKEEKK